MSDWSECSLGNVCDVIAGQSPKSSAYNDDGKGLPFYQGKKDFADRYLSPPTKWTTSITKVALPDDILMSVRAPVGPTNIATEEVCIGRGLAAIRASDKIDQGFLWYALMWMQPKIVGNAGAVFPSINKKQIEALTLPLPPLEEQKRIVAVLDQAFAALDRARANAEANLADAEALPQAAVDAIFLSPSIGWQESTLGDVCRFIGGSQPPKSVFEYSERPGLIRLIQIRDYKSDAKAVYVPTELAKRFCDANDVMIGRYGPPLFQILRGLDGAYNVALMKAVPDESRLSKDFLFYFLKNREILRYIEGASSRAAGQAGINKATIEPYPITFPPLEEQAAIVERLKSVWQRSETIIKNSRERLEDLKDLRQSILQKAFAGELT